VSGFSRTCRAARPIVGPAEAGHYFSRNVGPAEAGHYVSRKWKCTHNDRSLAIATANQACGGANAEPIRWARDRKILDGAQQLRLCRQGEIRLSVQKERAAVHGGAVFAISAMTNRKWRKSFRVP